MIRHLVPTPMLVLAIVLAACGGSGTTQSPAGTGAAGAQATGSAQSTTAVTQTAAASAGTGSGTGTGTAVGKPTGWDRYGKIHLEFAGPVQKVGDYGFVPGVSMFGGTQGSALNFAIQNVNEIVSLLIDGSGKVQLSYLGLDFQMPGAVCTTSNWNFSTSSGSGSFECTSEVTILASGANVAGGKIKGNFDAHG